MINRSSADHCPPARHVASVSTATATASRTGRHPRCRRLRDVYYPNKPDAVMHPCRPKATSTASIDGGAFIETIQRHLQHAGSSAARLWLNQTGPRRSASTTSHDDLVSYGSLAGGPVHRRYPYDTTLTYSASKAAAFIWYAPGGNLRTCLLVADQLLQQLRPLSFPESCAVIILTRWQGKPLPIYGDRL